VNLINVGIALGATASALSHVLLLHRRGIEQVLQRTRCAGALVHGASAGVLVGMGGLLITGKWVGLMGPLLRLYAKAQWPPV